MGAPTHRHDPKGAHKAPRRLTFRDVAMQRWRRRGRGVAMQRLYRAGAFNDRLQPLLPFASYLSPE